MLGVSTTIHAENKSLIDGNPPQPTGVYGYEHPEPIEQSGVGPGVMYFWGAGGWKIL